ncbi:hypothetical protein K469DRAFT_660198 [Zopfia rhizophila CBS 207.26]|uniref:Uncharacterized protein n=1 Tax=Zopfia rhizophila CBS 207.26 TaxID=1314779 RepID=A0A6A6EED6_9PEZI|nr:hypothetical protein K469DRAFT_660198 [Zopfia rhizophila CBS 207.26]
MEVAARTAPSQQTALVEFLRKLQQQKVTDPATGQQLKYDEDYNKTVWTEVPNFGITVADDWNFDATDPSPTSEEATRYENKTAFFAQLTASPANSVPDPENAPGPFDFSLYALWAFREAFEFSKEPRAPTITSLRAACYWVIYAADRLWANVQMGRDFRHKSSGSNPADEGDAYRKKGWVGFNWERWGVWVQGLENAREGGDEETARLVRSALKEVERIMDQGWRVRDEEKFA